MLLQLFARGYAHVPRLGEIGVREQARWPVVILLSNDQRHDLSAPMRSRCLYSWLPPPTPREEVRILQARCPEAPRTLLVQMVKLMHAVRSLPGITEKPGLRESIALLTALTKADLMHMQQEDIAEHLCFLARRRFDLENLHKSLARIEMIMHAPHDEIERWITEELHV